MQEFSLAPPPLPRYALDFDAAVMCRRVCVRETCCAAARDDARPCGMPWPLVLHRSAHRAGTRKGRWALHWRETPLGRRGGPTATDPGRRGGAPPARRAVVTLLDHLCRPCVTLCGVAVPVPDTPRSRGGGDDVSGSVTPRYSSVTPRYRSVAPRYSSAMEVPTGILPQPRQHPP